MSDPLLPLAQAPQIRRRGRPPGARNKASLGLGKYLEAMFGGLTPGQQAAELAMPKPAEVRRARLDAAQLGIRDEGMPLLQLAIVVKAERLAKALNITRAEAWAAMQKVLVELMPYVHQKQAPMSDTGKVAPPATAYLIPDGQAAELADFSDEGDVENIEFLPAADDQVGRAKSDD